MQFLQHKYSYEKYFPDPNPDKMLIQYFWRIYNMVHRQNFNFLAMITGKHRVGKSLTACNFADLLDKSFVPNLEERVVYTPQQFINCLDIIRKTNRAGACIVWDESGIGYGSRDWQTNINKILGYEIQALGYLRPIIFFVSQDISFLDVQPRKLLHGIFEVSRSSNEYSEVKPFFLEYSHWRNKTYRHYPIFVGRNDGTLTLLYKIKKIRVRLPPEDVIERYEIHSQNFKDLTLEDVKTEIQSFEEYDKPEKTRSINDIVEEIVNDPDKFLSTWSKKNKYTLQRDLIKHYFGVTESKAKAIKQLAQNKLKKSE